MNIKKFQFLLVTYYLLPFHSKTMENPPQKLQEAPAPISMEEEPPLFVLKGQPITQKKAEDFIWQTGFRSLEWAAASSCCSAAIEIPIYLTDSINSWGPHFTEEATLGLVATSLLIGGGSALYCAKQACTIRKEHDSEDKLSILTSLVCFAPSQCACCLLGIKKFLNHVFHMKNVIKEFYE